MLAKRLGRNHELAAALWDTGWYEARMLTSFVDEPARVTPAQMDRWCRDFDNWAICDTVCFHLFDRTPHAWAKVAQWRDRRDEFVKRAAFALLWSLTVHDKRADDEPFAEGLPLIERAATDERNFVKKAVNMALRAIGKRNPALNAAAVTVARRLADSPRGRGALGGEGRAQGAHQSRGDPAAARRKRHSRPLQINRRRRAAYAVFGGATLPSTSRGVRLPCGPAGGATLPSTSTPGGRPGRLRAGPCPPLPRNWPPPCFPPAAPGRPRGPLRLPRFANPPSFGPRGAPPGTVSVVMTYGDLLALLSG